MRHAARVRVGLPAVALAVAAALSCYCAPAGGSGAPAPALSLPADIVYSRTVGPDSAVSFSHETHVPLAGNRCLGCHPAPFRMLTPSHRTTHAEMNAGGSCGICHDGKRAFGVTEGPACQTCHAGSRNRLLAEADSTAAGGRPIPRRKLPPALTFVRGEASPGSVTFRHSTHMKGAATCAACHPKPFAMKVSGGRAGGGWHESGACGSCHAAGRAFDVADAASCERCHAASESKP